MILDVIKVGVIMVLLDSIYLTAFKKHFANQILIVQSKPMSVQMLPVIVTYCILVFGLYYFIIKQRKSVMDAALLGFVIYGVYEFTNKSIIKDWTYFTAVLDVTWGTILFGLTSYLYNILNKIL
uniref:DUF2177 family protein n=1 Tax=viral metagenome TaxID=1070528 RepID=A0A6C0E5B4_9ZZZZ